MKGSCSLRGAILPVPLLHGDCHVWAGCLLVCNGWGILQASSLPLPGNSLLMLLLYWCVSLPQMINRGRRHCWQPWRRSSSMHPVVLSGLHLDPCGGGGADEPVIQAEGALSLEMHDITCEGPLRRWAPACILDVQKPFVM
jgi:hypothetical protein